MICACSSAEERQQAQARHEIDECAKRGFTQGTADFDDCRLEVRQREERKVQDRESSFDSLENIESNRPGRGNPAGYTASW